MINHSNYKGNLIFWGGWVDFWENDGKTIQKAIDDFQKKFGLSDQEIKELFKRYNDTSRTAYRIKNNLPKVSNLDKLRKFSY